MIQRMNYRIRSILLRPFWIRRAFPLTFAHHTSNSLWSYFATADEHVLKSTGMVLTSLLVILQLTLCSFYLVMFQYGCSKLPGTSRLSKTKSILWSQAFRVAAQSWDRGGEICMESQAERDVRSEEDPSRSDDSLSRKGHLGGSVANITSTNLCRAV